MQSFLAVKWEDYGSCLKLVPKDFILGPLMRGLNDPVHHKEFGWFILFYPQSWSKIRYLLLSWTLYHVFFVIGVKEIYTSWTIGAAARFLCQYASCMKERYAVIGTYAALFLQTSCKLKMGVDF